MRRPHVVPPGRTQQFTDRTINRYRITRRLHGTKADATIFVRREFAAQIHVSLSGILVFVKPFRRRLPDIDFGADDRLTVSVAEARIDEQSRTRRRRTHDRAAVRRLGRMHSPEWAERVGIGLGLTIVAVVEKADQRRQTE